MAKMNFKPENAMPDYADQEETKEVSATPILSPSEQQHKKSSKKKKSSAPPSEQPAPSSPLPVEEPQGDGVQMINTLESDKQQMKETV